ncbi:MAG: biotin/lipoate A/B protein ligase family protein [Pirellulaceae bacterium]
MKLLELTLPTVAENLALDEALLEEAEAESSAGEVLRLWESGQPAVVVGRASDVAGEVNLPFCVAHDIPVLRRCSGGASVVIGPGCLMYGVGLSLERRPSLRAVEQAHRFVLERVAAALARCGLIVTLSGTSDLALADRKVSGNSLRCKREWLLYHGTILYGLSPALIQQCLRTAPRQPAYRRARRHEEFVATVPESSANLRAAFRAEWAPDDLLVHWPYARTQRLVAQRYARDDWNLRR